VRNVTGPTNPLPPQALPTKYSHYRTVRGDGRCGWRAIGYGYFETLIHLGESTKFFEEESRLKSLSNVLIAAGYSKDVFEDFTDETYDLMRKVSNALATGSGDADQILHEAFNDESIQNFIITHLRVSIAHLHLKFACANYNSSSPRHG
jgi:ubiquitin thioesterase protein OTUB1